MTENTPGSRPEPVFNIPATILFAAFALIATHAAGVLFADVPVMQNAVSKAAFTPALFKQFPGTLSFTLITYSVIHADWTHLLNNSAWLVAFGSPVAFVLGAKRFVLFWCVCSAMAALTHLAVDPFSTFPMVGASGAVSGMMGAVARAGLQLRVGADHPVSGIPMPTIAAVLSSRNVLVFLLVYLIVNFGIGLSEVVAPGMSSIAWQAHIGGLLAGFVLFPQFVLQRMS